MNTWRGLRASATSRSNSSGVSAIGAPSRRHLVGLHVDLDRRVGRPDGERLAGDVLVVAQPGPHPGDELLGLERLHDVVVGAGLEAEHDVDGVGLGGQHDDRGAALGADRPAHVDARHARAASGRAARCRAWCRGTPAAPATPSATNDGSKPSVRSTMPSISASAESSSTTRREVSRAHRVIPATASWRRRAGTRRGWRRCGDDGTGTASDDAASGAVTATGRLRAAAPARRRRHARRRGRASMRRNPRRCLRPRRCRSRSCRPRIVLRVQLRHLPPVGRRWAPTSAGARLDRLRPLVGALGRAHVAVGALLGAVVTGCSPPRRPGRPRRAARRWRRRWRGRGAGCWRCSGCRAITVARDARAGPLRSSAGVWLWGVWAVAAPAMMVEGIGAVAGVCAARRSWCAAAFWRTWGIRALGWLVAAVLGAFVPIAVHVLASPYRRATTVFGQPAPAASAAGAVRARRPRSARSCPSTFVAPVSAGDRRPALHRSADAQRRAGHRAAQRPRHGDRQPAAP